MAEILCRHHHFPSYTSFAQIGLMSKIKVSTQGIYAWSDKSGVGPKLCCVNRMMDHGIKKKKVFDILNLGTHRLATHNVVHNEVCCDKGFACRTKGTFASAWVWLDLQWLKDAYIVSRVVRYSCASYVCPVLFLDLVSYWTWTRLMYSADHCDMFTVICGDGGTIAVMILPSQTCLRVFHFKMQR